LEIKLSEQRGLVVKASESESNYRQALAGQMTKLRIEGMPATLIPDLARGTDFVAKLKYQRDIDRGISNACIEAIKSIRSSMSGVQSLISAYKEGMKLL